MNQNHRENLQKLADYLTTLPSTRFYMGTYRKASNTGQTLTPIEPEPECGTVCCAAGSGPAAGIPTLETDLNWGIYIERVFGFDENSPEYDWMFSGGWALTDNSPEGAAKRINHYLEHGVPENSSDQQYGNAPYLFRRRFNMNQNHRENLQKLADYLTTLPSVNFNMWRYRQDKQTGLHLTLQDPEPECGTVCCAAGSGPLAGIPTTKQDRDWADYTGRVFGLSPDRNSTRSDWVWLFSGAWRDIDNTPQGAAKRINHYLKHGTPSNSAEQLRGSEPYIFSGDLT